MQKKLGDANQVSERLGIPKLSVLRMAREGVLPHVHIGRLVRFDMEQLETWIRNGGQRLEAPQSEEAR